MIESINKGQQQGITRNRLLIVSSPGCSWVVDKQYANIIGLLNQQQCKPEFKINSNLHSMVRQPMLENFTKIQQIISQPGINFGATLICRKYLYQDIYCEWKNQLTIQQSVNYVQFYTIHAPNSKLIKQNKLEKVNQDIQILCAVHLKGNSAKHLCHGLRSLLNLELRLTSSIGDFNCYNNQSVGCALNQSMSRPLQINTNKIHQLFSQLGTTIHSVSDLVQTFQFVNNKQYAKF